VGLGAILPDIIDKFIGRVIFANSFSSGRIFAHTLFFSIILFIVGSYVYGRKKDGRILYIAGAAFLHLLENRLWSLPQVLFWPLFGWKFPHGAIEEYWIDYFLNIIQKYFAPVFSFDFISEAVGLILVIFLAILIHRRKK